MTSCLLSWNYVALRLEDEIRSMSNRGDAKPLEITALDELDGFRVPKT